MRERGQAIIEFAVIAPIMMLLLFMLLDVGLLLIRRATLDDAVRIGAIEGAAGVPVATVQAYAADHSLGLLNADDVIVCMVDDEHVRVSGEWSWAWLSGPLVAHLGGGDLTDVVLHPSATRRLDIEQPPAPTPSIETDIPPCQ